MVAATAADAAAAAVLGNTMCSFFWQMPFMAFPMGGIVSLILLLALGYMVYKLYSTAQQTKHVNTAAADKDASLDILKNRLARGEIHIEEFEKLKAVLQA